MNFMCNHIKLNQQDFSATYDFGINSQQVPKKSLLASIAQDILIFPLKPIIYPAASLLKNRINDNGRIELSRSQLIGIGGKVVSMKTPDGDIIEGMHINTKDFKSTLLKYCDLIEKNNGDGTIKQFLVIKSKYCKIETKSSYMAPDPEVVDFFNQVIRPFGFNFYPKGKIPDVPHLRGYVIELGNIPKDLAVPSSANKSEPTALIATGSGMSYAAYKGLALSYLLRGINVMLVDYRGYGRSSGSPTDYKTKLDLETAYQYLRTQKNVNDTDIIVHGHCIGGGPASDLAARRAGVHLLLDRTFADYSDFFKIYYPYLCGLVYNLMSYIVNYNNAENLIHVKGNIAIAKASEDNVIHEEHITKLIDHLPENKGQYIKLLQATRMGHTGLWTENSETSLEFNQFLDKTKLRRKLF